VIRATLIALALLTCVSTAKAAPIVESTGDMTVALFNPLMRSLVHTFDGVGIVWAWHGVSIAQVPDGAFPNPFELGIPGASDDPFIYELQFPALLMGWDNGAWTFCTNCRLSAVPLPASSSMFLSGLLGLFIRRRKL